MPRDRSSRIINVNIALAILTIVVGLVCSACAQTEKVLYAFTGGSDGRYPGIGLVLDGAGNLYGATGTGGDITRCGGSGCGVVFELSPTSATSWREHVIHTFTGRWDGGMVFGGTLISDAAGNLYGQASVGGNLNYCVAFGPGCGAVFELSRASTGGWKEKILHDFKDGKDGSYPLAGVVADPAGNLYGTTEYGGSTIYCNGSNDGCGAAFMLSPTATSGWKETVLHFFTSGKDGGTPYDSLIVDSAGNLYGTALIGGSLAYCSGSGCGVVFKLSRTSSGAWKETVLHAFTGGKDGAYPWAGLIFDAKGNLYGTAMQGGSLINCRPGCGVVFKLSPSSNGLWTETVLHTFGGSQDGAYPGANMIFDTQGNLYGTTWQGGVPSCNSGHGCGVVFKLSPTASGPWTETVLHVFTAGSDGWQPDASLVPDAAGNLYGTTQYGGGNFSVCAPYGCGTVFEIMP